MDQVLPAWLTTQGLILATMFTNGRDTTISTWPLGISHMVTAIPMWLKRTPASPLGLICYLIALMFQFVTARQLAEKPLDYVFFVQFSIIALSTTFLRWFSYSTDPKDSSYRKIQAVRMLGVLALLFTFITLFYSTPVHQIYENYDVRVLLFCYVLIASLLIHPLVSGWIPTLSPFLPTVDTFLKTVMAYTILSY